MKQITTVPLGRMQETIATLQHPERTAYRCLDWDYTFFEFPNRPAMVKCIRIQERGSTPPRTHYKAVVKLSIGEGY